MRNKLSILTAALLACTASQISAAGNRQAERDLFAKIVEIPTVEGRTAEFGKLTTLLTAEFRKVHQFNVFTVNTPCQIGIADYMRDASRHLGLARFYEQKRDFFREQLRASRFELLPCCGTYFQLARYASISGRSDREFAEWLTRDVGVAAIPVSAFHPDGRDDGVVRFCFAKREETLAAAGEKLRQI